MLPELRTLIRLQDRDQAILRIRTTLDRIPEDEESARERLEGDLQAVESAKAELQENEIAVKNLEIDIESKQNAVLRFKNQQLETRKNAEYQALGHEIERFSNDASELETQELELMEAGDAIRAKLKAAEESLASTRALVDEELTALSERSQTADEQVQALEEERAEIAGELDEDTLDFYERLLAGKGDIAVVPLRGDKCGGCHMNVIKSTQLHVKADKEITRCEQCSRILYLEEE